MAGSDTSKVLFAELVLFAEDLSGTDDGEAKKLQKLVRAIRKAIDDEREGALKEIGDLRSKHQNGTIELVNVKADLEQTTDENRRLKGEIQEFESMWTGSRKRSGPRSVDISAEEPASPRSNGE